MEQCVKRKGFIFTEMGRLIYDIIFLGGMAYKNTPPFIGLYVQKEENASLERIAKEHKIKKTQLARACMRLGLQLFDQEDPKEILTLTKVDGC